MRKIFCFISFLGALTGCYHEPELYPDVPPVCFENEVLPVIQSSCVRSGCHGGGEAFALNDYSAIANHVTPGKPMASELHKVISTDYGFLRMPPPPDEPLTPSQIDKISLWILQGAENTSCQETCDTLNITFSGSVMGVLNTYCRGCHSGDNPSGGFILTDYPSVKIMADNGKLSGSINWQTGYLPMPENQDKLSACNLAIIRKWIAADTPNN
ncbi:MAG TPA: hypothetical protein VK212_03100 [Lentimicrobium sp.]|nr:hypothetical protein [Lentimicrobium sp.]